MSGVSPERRAMLYIEDVIGYSNHAINSRVARTDAELEVDLQAQFAIIRAIEVIGEAARGYRTTCAQKRQRFPGATSWR
jgi:uncharacterized protein with HEPN domain